MQNYACKRYLKCAFKHVRHVRLNDYAIFSYVSDVTYASKTQYFFSLMPPCFKIVKAVRHLKGKIIRQQSIQLASKPPHGNLSRNRALKLTPAFSTDRCWSVIISSADIFFKKKLKNPQLTIYRLKKAIHGEDINFISLHVAFSCKHQLIS